MIRALDDLLPGTPLLNILLDLADEDQQVYLVGGKIRDMLMQKPGKDLDFAVTGDVLKLARKTADRIGAAFYVMDAVRKTARLIYFPANSGHRWILDFSALQGSDIRSDLKARDFTVNALALDLRSPEKIIDPLSGARDIKDGILRMCRPTSFTADPIRVVRAVRQALELGFRITPETVSALKSAVPMIGTTSPERQRDELFKMLESGKAAAGLRTAFTLGVFHTLLPEVETLKGVAQSSPHTLDVFDHTLAVVGELDTLFTVLVEPYSEEKGASLLHGLAVLELGRFREQLTQHFANSVTPERSRRGLLNLAGLYHDIAKPLVRTVEADNRIRFLDHENIGEEVAKTRGKALMLSSDEVDRLGILVRDHMRIHQLAKTGKEISRKALFRFFRDTGDTGIDLVLLALADLLGTYGVTITPEYWQQELQTCRQLLDAWYFHRTEYLQPEKLVDGKDLMDSFQLPPGPLIGMLLEYIREAQATGQVVSREQALSYARGRLAIENEG